MQIYPGMTVQLSASLGLEEIKHHRAMVYEIEGRKIIISQATPPLRKDHMNCTLLISAIFKQRGQQRRFGVNVQLTELIKDYKLSSGDQVLAFEGSIISSFSLVDLREYFRVIPSSASELYFVLEKDEDKEEHPIINISLGGILFSQSSSCRTYKSSEKITLFIIIEDIPVKTYAKVMRTEERNANCFIACKFMEGNKDLQAFLGKKIIDIQRYQLVLGRF